MQVSDLRVCDADLPINSFSVFGVALHSERKNRTRAVSLIRRQLSATNARNMRPIQINVPPEALKPLSCQRCINYTCRCYALPTAHSICPFIFVSIEKIHLQLKFDD